VKDEQLFQIGYFLKDYCFSLEKSCSQGWLIGVQGARLLQDSGTGEFPQVQYAPRMLTAHPVRKASILEWKSIVVDAI